MSDEDKKNQSSLVSSRTRNLKTRSSGLVKRGLELLSSRRERTTHFPSDRSMGWLDIQDQDDPDSEWEDFGEARGNVTVPLGKNLRLTVSEDSATDLSPLSKLEPNDLHSIKLTKPEIKDTDLIHIQRLTGLKELYISMGTMYWKLKSLGAPALIIENLLSKNGLPQRAEITDAGLLYLQNLTALQSLELGYTNITDAGLKYIQSLTSLRWLSLIRTQISDTGLAYLQRLTALRVLYLQETQITGAGLIHLQGLTELEELDLSGSRITNVHLRGLTGLRKLNISGTQITDVGLAYLEGLTGLEDLNLSDTPITDAGLVYLYALANLLDLNLLNTEVSYAGFTSLKRALPNCLIIHSLWM